MDEGLVEVEVLGDREFVGNEWNEYIGSKFGGYIIRVRVKKDYEVRDGRLVEDIVRDMGEGEVRDIKRDGWRLVIKKLRGIEGRRDEILALETMDMKSEVEELLDR